MTRNLVSPRLRGRSGETMRGHDRLPPALRQWRAAAALPWSVKSCLRLWQGALRETGSEAAALERLNRAEAATLRREARAVWGAGYPG